MNALSSIAASGMAAAQTRLQVSAGHIAQRGINPEEPTRQTVRQSAQTGGGVSTSVASTTGTHATLEADVVAQLEAKNAFLANLAVFKTADKLRGALLDERV